MSHLKIIYHVLKNSTQRKNVSYSRCTERRSRQTLAATPNYSNPKYHYL